MKFEEFLKQTIGLPLVETKLLLNLVDNSRALLVQISRWEKAGKLRKLKRGTYLLAPSYRKIEVFGPYLASSLVRPSYVSLEKALEFHGMIPEAIASYTSITTKRPVQFEAEGTLFEYRHVKRNLFWGYESVNKNGQTGFIARPEKALLDLFYLHDGEISREYLHGLRLGNINKVDVERLHSFARRFGKPKILQAAAALEEHFRESASEETILKD
jgi:predicted transcriptional regulator of viral defense system